MAIAMVSVDTLKKDTRLDPRDIREAKVTYVEGGESFESAAIYHKAAQTGDVRLAVEKEIPTNVPVKISLANQDGVKNSDYVGTFDEKGTFIPTPA